MFDTSLHVKIKQSITDYFKTKDPTLKKIGKYSVVSITPGSRIYIVSIDVEEGDEEWAEGHYALVFTTRDKVLSTFVVHYTHLTKIINHLIEGPQESF